MYEWRDNSDGVFSRLVPIVSKETDFINFNKETVLASRQSILKLTVYESESLEVFYIGSLFYLRNIVYPFLPARLLYSRNLLSRPSVRTEE